MVRRFFRDSAIYGAAGLIGQGVSFLMFPFLAHVLRPRAYGVIDIVGLLTTLTLLTVALEINQGLGRKVADLDDQAEWTAYASTALVWSLACYTAFVGIGVILARPLTTLLLGANVDAWVTRVGLVGIWVGGALYLLQDQFRWRNRPKSFATVSIVVAVVTVGSTAIYVFVLGGRALGVIAGQATGASAGLLIALALSRGYYRVHFEWQKARSMLTYSLPLVPGSIGVLLNGYADRLAIQHQQSLLSVGVYGVGFRLAVVVSLLLIGVQGATTPLVLTQHAAPETPHELALVFRLFWAVGCVIFLVLSVLAEPLVALLSAPAYFGAARVVPFLVPAAFLAGLYVFAPGPTIAGRTKAFAAINLTAGLLNLAMAFALVPSLGIRGAGLATLVSSMVSFIATMVLSQRLYPVPHDWLRLILGAAVATLIVVATRSVLVSGRVGTLSLGLVLARVGICIGGSLAVAVLLVDASRLRNIRWRERARPA